VNETLTVQSHKGPYQVFFESPFRGLEEGLKENEFLIIDEKVAKLYQGPLRKALSSPRVLKIEAVESNKSLERMPDYVTYLCERGIKRGYTLVAVGGGIIEDIVSFLSAVLFRGLPWRFYPTTLLAQADSCIGSKSSINVGSYKNQVGTFTPPKSISIATEVLETLTQTDVCSGIGEILKVHLIAGRDDFQRLEGQYDRLTKDKSLLVAAIRRSLEIKKAIIEKDEFDQNERLILNYGHSFGHALESATEYGIPHGIGVTIGVDMANYVSCQLGLMDIADYNEIHPVLIKNYAGFEKTQIPMERFFSALSKDKKNVGKDVSLILSKGPGRMFRDRYPLDGHLKGLCEKYLKEIRA